MLKAVAAVMEVRNLTTQTETLLTVVASFQEVVSVEDTVVEEVLEADSFEEVQVSGKSEPRFMPNST